MRDESLINYIDKGLKTEFSEDIKQRLINHRNRFYHLFLSRYMELLPTLIKYDDKSKLLSSIDTIKLEYSLRNNYNIVLGETTSGNIQIIGYMLQQNSFLSPKKILDDTPRNKDDIQFIIPFSEQLPDYQEITYHDNCQSGNFVVIQNKLLSYVSDFEVLDHYAIELAELTTSRFSIALQSKVLTFFIGQDVGDEDINELVTDIYNGSPYIKTGKFFDPNEQIIKLDNSTLANNLQELKREYQNKISELNNMLGIQSLAVDKSSGVSESEVNGNKGFTTSNANLYLTARNYAFSKLSKRYGIEIEAYYDDEVSSELQEFNKQVELKSGGSLHE